MTHTIKILPTTLSIEAESGTNLLSLLRQNGLAPEAPCGGHGTCKKCKVMVNGQALFACRTIVDRDMTVLFPERAGTEVLAGGTSSAWKMNPQAEGYLLAFDIGTTTVVCYLLDSTSGSELAHACMLNPQSAYGADVITRIQAALSGELLAQEEAIRSGMTALVYEVCQAANIRPEEIGIVSIVGNPTMQQLFMGIAPSNLATVPFAPALTEAAVVSARDYLPVCENASMLVIPDISGYVGADTMGCILSTGLHRLDQITLMVDIGTNGEMVLGNKHRLIACSAAAGPALEGARIKFGMRAAPGAIDHVRFTGTQLDCSVIGNQEARGICGSGLVDAIAALLRTGVLNRRGRIQTRDELQGERIVYLTSGVYLTQEDIREVQLAKGAIAAGIELMAEHLGIPLSEIDQVLLAGAFGSLLDSKNACRIGLLPPELQGKITAVGNAAGNGAKLLACDKDLLSETQELICKTEFLELADMPGFRQSFAKNMMFREG